MKRILLLIFTVGIFSLVNSQSFTWNGSISSDWNTASNWTPAGIPGAANDVIINNGMLPNYPVLSGATSILSLTISAGSLDLNGNTLTISGAKNSVFSGGTVSNGSISFNIATGNNLTFSGSFTCNADLSGSAGRILFNGGTFNNLVNLSKTGTTTYANGGSTFNAPVSLTNSSNAIWRLANLTADVFNALAIFQNTGTSQFQVEYAANATYIQPFVLLATSGIIRVGGPSANVILNNFIDVTGISSSSVIFESCTFDQNPLSLTLGTNGTFQSINSTFNFDFTLNTSRFLSQSSTYQGKFNLTRNNNTTADNSFGGNTFNGDVNIELNGTIGGRFGNNAGDIFNSKLDVTNNSSANFIFANTGINLFTGSIDIRNNTSAFLTFGNTGTSDFNNTINVVNNSTGTIRFAQATGCLANFNSSININNIGGGNVRFGNGGGVSNWNTGVLLNIIDFTNGGTLQLNNINQIDNTLTQTIAMPTGSLVVSNCTWEAVAKFQAPLLTTANSTYNNVTSLHKNGAGTSTSTGGNVFNNSTTIENTTGTFRLANTTGDDFNADVTFINNSGTLVPVYNTSSTFAGDVTVNSATTINFNGLANSYAVFDGSGTINLTATSGVNLFRNVILNNPTLKLVLNNEMQINNAGTLQITAGELILNSKILKVANPLGTAISRTSGGIVSESTDHNGRVEWAINTNTDVHEFPFINTSSEYVPFIVTLTSGNLGTVQASTYGTAADNLPYPVGVTELLNNSARNNSKFTADRFFVITPSGVGFTADASFGYGTSEVQIPNTIDENMLKAQRWNGTLWEDPVGSVNVVLKRVSVTGISQFSPWTIVDASEPLPVQFMNFDAKVNGLVVDLNWTTANEKNNSYFSIERSLDATNYESIGKVNGAGNSNTPKSYQYADFNPAKGISYYRIKQVDFNGLETYSQIRTIRFDQLIGWISYYPNPVSNTLTFNLSQTNALDIDINIVNSLGQSVWKNNLKPQLSNEYTLDVSNWSKGVYFVNVKIDGKTTTSKLVVQ